MSEATSAVERLDPLLWIADYPLQGARRFPDRQAIIADDISLTYAELERLSNGVAAYLTRHQIAAGDRIAYIGKNSGLFFPLFFACLFKGVVLVPINWRCAPAEINFILNDSGCCLIVHDAGLQDTIAQAVSKLPVAPRLLPVEGATNSLRQVLNAVPASVPGVREGQPDECALLMYTSGTTGKPKGVMLSHRALSLAREVERDLSPWKDWSDNEVILSAMPNFHVGGLSWMLIGLMRSQTCVLTATATPANLLQLSRRHRITQTFMVPTVIRALLDEITSSGGEAPQFKTIFYGASTMDVALVTRCISVFGCNFCQYFGMTENCGSVTFLPPTAHDAKRPELLRSVGREFPGMHIEIRNTTGKVLGAGEPGEIWISSPTLMNGYWHHPAATAEALIDGWYRSGDGGYLDKDRYLYLTDRIKDMIISGGENIYPIEVEQALRQHPAIRDVVVVGVPDPVWGEAIAAVVEWHDGKSATLEEVRQFARQLIAGYKLPKVLKAVPALPRTATGKLKRGEVRKAAAEMISQG